MQVNDADLAKIRLKCLELAVSHDVPTTLSKAARYTAWVMRDRTARTERTAPGPDAPPPPPPERAASFKLGMEEMGRRLEAAGVKPSLIEKARSTLFSKKKS